MRAAAAVLVLALPAIAGDASARRSTLAEGLDRPSSHAMAQGIQALRAPLEGRVHIAAGTFMMGSTTTEILDAQKMCRSPTMNPAKQETLEHECDEAESLTKLEAYPHEVTLHAFDIDRTEVRVVDYERCVAIGRCTAPKVTPGDSRFDAPNYPVTLVRWEDADGYCKWTGGRLPTEAEWEFAARGTRRRIFPWGDTYNPHLANHGALAFDSTDASDGFARLAPVGSFPDGATPEGLLDMAGNVAEWVADFVGEPDRDGSGYSPSPSVDPTGPPTGVYHMVRGGSYASPALSLRTAGRSLGVRIVDLRSADIGFRCASNAE